MTKAQKKTGSELVLDLRHPALDGPNRPLFAKAAAFIEFSLKEIERLQSALQEAEKASKRFRERVKDGLG